MKLTKFIITIMIIFNAFFSVYNKKSRNHKNNFSYRKSNASVDLTKNSNTKALESNNKIKTSAREAPDYDYYIFSLQWGESFCRNQLGTSENCLMKLNSFEKKNILRIHGLWPSKIDTFELGYCNNGSKVRISKENIPNASALKELWPSLGNFETVKFWEHEYNKHGFCYSKKHNHANHKKYFEKSLELYKSEGFENLISNAFPELQNTNILSYDSIMKGLSKTLGEERKNFEIYCIQIPNEGQYLKEIRFFYDLDFKRMNEHNFRSNCYRGKGGIIKFNKEGTVAQRNK